MICSVPECQTTAGCQCNSPYVVSVRKIWMDENASIRSRISDLEKALANIAWGERDGDGKFMRSYSASECQDFAQSALMGDRTELQDAQEAVEPKEATHALPKASSPATGF